MNTTELLCYYMISASRTFILYTNCQMMNALTPVFPAVNWFLVGTSKCFRFLVLLLFGKASYNPQDEVVSSSGSLVEIPHCV